MGAFSYCRTCDNGLRAATAQEVIDGVQLCRAGHENTPNMSKDQLIVDMCERIEELERRLENHLA